MITEILGLAGSGILGSIFSVITDSLHRRGELQYRKMELKAQARAKEQGHVINYLQDSKGFTTSRAYHIAFILLVVTYCSCCLLCIMFPDVALQTFDPDNDPRKFSLVWGLISWTIDHKTVYTITTGGVGYALLHPIAFQIGTVITGVTPTHRG